MLRKLKERHDLSGFAVVTTDTGDKDIDWHMRFFAPSLGVAEDPVTGSANGPMAVFLWENGFLDETKKYFTFRASQGRFVGRPGLINVIMTIDRGEVDSLQIAGQAVTVLDGTMTLSPQIPEKL